mmetsp:Transcript_12177/g.50427  ORF Transcript_12177/g.50427 Transcript_12177/m.50427 type:complete len:80 (+) Transcript_12177:150-389(+)
MEGDKMGQLMTMVESQNQLNMMAEVLETITVRCFEKCIYSPGKEMTSKEKDCSMKCMDRFVETMNIVSDTLRSRSNQLP